MSGISLKDKNKDKDLFYDDLRNMFLLVVLYMFQGLPMGLFLQSIPVIFKKYLSYQEVGVIMMATMPYSFKVFWAPLVELYYLPQIGKRKSWIVPTQLIGSGILFYLSGQIEQLLQNKEVYFLTGLLISNTFIITCQDIAVDSWAVEILHPQNSSYASACQSVGIRVGIVLSTSIFLAFNSIDFSNKYIFQENKQEPFLTVQSFILYWAIFQILTTFYILLFVPEKKQQKLDEKGKQEESDDDEVIILPSQVFDILKDILKNKYLIKYILFLIFTCCAYSIDQNVSQVYLTNELKFSKESLSFVKIISAPANIICAFLSSYLSASKPFRFLFQISVVCLIFNSYSIFVLIGTFPKEEFRQQSFNNILHVGIFQLLNELAGNIWFVSSYAIICQIIDKRLAGIHITLLASITNLSQFMHKFYIFWLVDKFGIFVPQIVLFLIALSACLYFKDDMHSLDDLPSKEWLVSDSIICSNPQKQSGKIHEN